MNKSILKIAVPAILSNVIVPLLGLVDLTIAGHIGDAVTIGAVSVGATMFSLTYWNFGFLRMGTSGLTAQAFGARDRRQMSVMLFRSVALALLLGIAIVALQSPIRWLLLAAISPSEPVPTHADADRPWIGEQVQDAYGNTWTRLKVADLLNHARFLDAAQS